jgi:hypothetical protein
MPKKINSTKKKTIKYKFEEKNKKSLKGDKKFETNPSEKKISNLNNKVRRLEEKIKILEEMLKNVKLKRN